MPNIIRYDETIIDEALKRAKESLMAKKYTTGSFTVNLCCSADEKCYVELSYKAMYKINALVKDYTTEVAWHGLVDRLEDNRFFVSDILVYPQKLTGGYVDMDIENYYTWGEGLDNETYSRMKLQGHSHVNMGTTPSSTDTDHQQQVVNKLIGNDKFYIFMIVNKSGSMWISVYDLERNIQFKSTDPKKAASEVVVDVVDEEYYPHELFMKDATSHTSKLLVETYTTGGYTTGKPVQNYTQTTQTSSKEIKVLPSPHSKTRQKQKDRYTDEYEQYILATLSDPYGCSDNPYRDAYKYNK